MGSDNFVDVESLVYADLAPELDAVVRQAFLDAFFTASGLDRSHFDEAMDLLVFAFAAAEPDCVLRVDFEFSGATMWELWSGDADEARSIAATLGRDRGAEIEVDQHHGPTGWE